MLLHASTVCNQAKCLLCVSTMILKIFSKRQQNLSSKPEKKKAAYETALADFFTRFTVVVVDRQLYLVVDMKNRLFLRLFFSSCNAVRVGLTITFITVLRRIFIDSSKYTAVQISIFNLSATGYRIKQRRTAAAAAVSL